MIVKYFEILRWKILCKNDDFIPLSITLFIMMAHNEKGSSLKLGIQICQGKLYSGCN